MSNLHSIFPRDCYFSVAVTSDSLVFLNALAITLFLIRSPWREVDSG